MFNIVYRLIVTVLIKQYHVKQTAGCGCSKEKIKIGTGLMYVRSRERYCYHLSVSGRHQYFRLEPFRLSLNCLKIPMIRI